MPVSFETIPLSVGEVESPIFIGRGLLDISDEVLPRLPHRVFLVSSERVFGLHGDRLLRAVRMNEVVPILIDDREEAKTMGTCQLILDGVLRAGGRRDDALVALGGGVVTDVAGFAAAILVRGLRWYAIPTTLLGMVDAAIGGKTGVDHETGKNMIGAFHFPEAILADPELLSTLAERDYRSGLVEALKNAWIGDEALASEARRQIGDLLRRKPEAVDHLVEGAARVKAKVVVADPRETGLRRILNFGHTLGHAFEAAGAFSSLTHGEAVAWGMAAALKLSVSRAGLSRAVAKSLMETLQGLGPFPEPVRDPGILLPFLLRDKKSRAEGISGILLEEVGKPRIDRIPQEDWLNVAQNVRL